MKQRFIMQSIAEESPNKLVLKEGFSNDFEFAVGDPIVVTKQIAPHRRTPNLKRIQVVLRYPDTAGQLRDLEAISYLNNDTRANFR